MAKPKPGTSAVSTLSAVEASESFTWPGWERDKSAVGRATNWCVDCLLMCTP